MARIPYPDPEKISAEAAEALRSMPQMNTFRMLAHSPAMVGPWGALGRALLTEGSLDPALREIAILRVAALSPGATYEWDQHEVIARQCGVTDAQIEGARTGGGLDGDAALIVRFTEEVVRDVAASDATWDAVAAVLGAAEMVELVLVIGHYMGVARYLVNLRIDSEPPAGANMFDQGS
jgi:4-carboxymuconolactone decarboxylase